MIDVRKCHKAGHVTVNVALNCNGYGDMARIAGSTKLTTGQARALAQSLIVHADKADARDALDAAALERRRKWRDREVAAGRMRISTVKGFLHD